MNKFFDALGEAAVSATLDANSGYWQEKVEDPDQNKTTFASHYELYRFVQIPFGLKNF